MQPKPPTPPAAAKPTAGIKFRKPDTQVGHRVLLYGRPGCGKTTLMLKGLPRPLVAFDFDNSINILLQKPQEESGIDPTDIYLADIPRDAENRLDYGAFLTILRDATELCEDGKTRRLSKDWASIKSVLIDTGTFAEKAIEPYLFEHPDKYPTGREVLRELREHRRKCRRSLFVVDERRLAQVRGRVRRRGLLNLTPAQADAVPGRHTGLTTAIDEPNNNQTGESK